MNNPLGKEFESVVLENHTTPWSLKRLECIYESPFFPAVVAFVVIFVELLIVKPSYILAKEGDAINYNSVAVASLVCSVIVYTAPFLLKK
jgi:hypothetical protein